MAICLSAFPCHAQFFTNLETGVFFTGYNDIRDGSDGTLISYPNDFNAKIAPFIRLRGGTEFKKHHFSILIAPLTVRAENTFANDIRFDGQTFEANNAIESQYTFNSYRFTYNYKFIHKPKFNFGAGGSVKVRQAGTVLKNSTQKGGNISFGFVPLVNIQMNYQFHHQWQLHLFADGLVAEQGRAEDVLLATRYALKDNVDLQLGYRIFEGGSDGVNNYNFILLHVASIGIHWEF